MTPSTITSHSALHTSYCSLTAIHLWRLVLITPHKITLGGPYLISSLPPAPTSHQDKFLFELSKLYFWIFQICFAVWLLFIPFDFCLSRLILTHKKVGRFFIIIHKLVQIIVSWVNWLPQNYLAYDLCTWGAANQIPESLRKDTYLCSIPSGAAEPLLQPMKKMSVSTAFLFGIFPCHCELAHKNKIWSRKLFIVELYVQ
jgi:hypothetical protein